MVGLAKQSVPGDQVSPCLRCAFHSREPLAPRPEGLRHKIVEFRLTGPLEAPGSGFTARQCQVGLYRGRHISSALEGGGGTELSFAKGRRPVFLDRFLPQEVSEQPVVAVLAVGRAEGEQAVCREVLEVPVGAGGHGDRRGEVWSHVLERRGPAQEVTHPCALRAVGVLGQVGVEIAFEHRVREDGVVRILPASGKRVADQHQTRRPALGVIEHVVELPGIGHGHPPGGDEVGRLFGREAQVFTLGKGEVVGKPQARELERRLVAGQHHEVDVVRQAGEQVVDRGIERL